MMNVNYFVGVLIIFIGALAYLGFFLAFYKVGKIFFDESKKCKDLIAECRKDRQQWNRKGGDDDE